MSGRGGLRRNAGTTLHHRVKLRGQYRHLLACHSRMARNDQFGIGHAQCPLACADEQPRRQQFNRAQPCRGDRYALRAQGREGRADRAQQAPRPRSWTARPSFLTVTAPLGGHGQGPSHRAHRPAVSPRRKCPEPAPKINRRMGLTRSRRSQGRPSGWVNGMGSHAAVW